MRWRDLKKKGVKRCPRTSDNGKRCKRRSADQKRGGFCLVCGPAYHWFLGGEKRSG